MRWLYCLLVYLLLILDSCVARFNPGDIVPVSFSKVWPYHNPFETYSFYETIPLCRPSHIQFENMSFGQILRGDRMVNSIYNIYFLEPIQEKLVCTINFTADIISRIQALISQSYMYEIFVNDLPVTRPFGFQFFQTEHKQYILPNHLHFILGYNDGYIVSVNVTSTNIILPSIDDASNNKTQEFYYTVSWFPDTTPIESRLYQQLVGAISTPQTGLDIHWLAITNSFILVLFITLILLVIMLRIVRTDLARYFRLPDEELIMGDDESGWKLLHADVFRAPTHRMWFCACVGSGAHICLVTILLVFVGCFSPYLQRGAALTGGLFGYLLTSFVAGYISANLYRRLGGVKWELNILVTVLMFMGPAFLMWGLLNMIALLYNSTSALPFSTTSTLVLCWLFVTLPLTILGALLGRHRASHAVANKTIFPCKTNRLAREIPMTHWRHSPWIHVIFSGFLPFGAIYMELHYVFLSLWGTRIYTLYGVLLCAFIMHLLVAGTVSILLTYFHLNGEDYKWWWRSFVAGGSVAFFFLLHCIYYFLTSTRMFGFLQCMFFFGYSLIVAWALFLMIGFVTFSCSYFFVTYIYSSIKCD